MGVTKGKVPTHIAFLLRLGKTKICCCIFEYDSCTMKYTIPFLLTCICWVVYMPKSNAQPAIFKKMDTTAQLGSTSYRVRCSNKKPDQNEVTILITGFEEITTDINLTLKGRIGSVQIDDLNKDGVADLVIFHFGGSIPSLGHVFTLLSSSTKTVNAVYLPDIRDDAKLRAGYRGFDAFHLIEGSLVRTFPIYTSSEPDALPTDTKRVVFYKIVAENGGFKYKPINTYETKK